jgi:hypothetical protein
MVLRFSHCCELGHYVALGLFEFVVCRHRIHRSAHVRRGRAITVKGKIMGVHAKADRWPGIFKDDLHDPLPCIGKLRESLPAPVVERGMRSR